MYRKRNISNTSKKIQAIKSRTKIIACRRSSVGRGGSSMHDEQNMQQQEK
jgi:hypothetical protein